jgi:hypothetical protein
MNKSVGKTSHTEETSTENKKKKDVDSQKRRTIVCATLFLWRLLQCIAIISFSDSTSSSAKQYYRLQLVRDFRIICIPSSLLRYFASDLNGITFIGLFL